MKVTEHAINVMAARTCKGIGKAWITKNLSNPKTESEIVELLNGPSKFSGQLTVEEFNSKKNLIKGLLAKSEGMIDGVVALGDDDFPPHRGVVKDSEKPIFIFYRGNLSLLATESKNIAVIGLLNPDQEIEAVEMELVARMVENGAIIVSGLALGCDTIAHRQTLDSKGRTVAILPGPLNDVLPAKNRGLSEEIVRNDGLLISEYLTSAKSKMELSGRYQEIDCKLFIVIRLFWLRVTQKTISAMTADQDWRLGMQEITQYRELLSMMKKMILIIQNLI